MGLEAPLALLGLLGALLPILVHRIRRRDLTPVPLPTMQLLVQAEAAKRRSRGLTDLLLLAVRVAIVVIACLSISAPYVTARLSFGDGSVASAAIVIDDSMSMMRRERDTPLLAQALERAHQALDSLPRGSEVAIVAGGADARMIARRSDDLEGARRTLEALPATSLRGNDLKAAIALGAQQLAGAKNPNRRLLVLSDFAAHTQIDSQDLALDGVSLTLERLGSLPPPSNLFLSSVSAAIDPGTADQISIAIEAGSSGTPPTRAPVSVHSGGKQLAQAEIAFEQGRGRALLHVPLPSELADPTALVRLDIDDALPEDNVAGVLLRRSDALQVMLVNGDPHPASRNDELHYALSALRLSPLPMSLRSVDASTLSRHELTHVDVLVLANVPAPSDALAERLRGYVQGGGGLIVAVGDHVQGRQYNLALGAVLAGSLRTRVEGKPVGVERASSAPIEPQDATGLDQTQVRKRFLLESEAEAWLRFSDGTPALVTAQIGRGRSALLATTLDADWTDLPFRPGYLPLLTQLIRDVGRAHGSVSGPVRAGEPVELAVPPGATRLEVIAPDGRAHAFDELEGRASVRFEATREPGPYRVLAASGRGALTDLSRGAFVVKTPSQESVLDVAAQGEAGAPDIRARAAEVRVQRGVAPYFFLLCALLVLTEGVLRLRR